MFFLWRLLRRGFLKEPLPNSIFISSTQQLLRLHHQHPCTSTSCASHSSFNQIQSNSRRYIRHQHQLHVFVNHSHHLHHLHQVQSTSRHYIHHQHHLHQLHVSVYHIHHWHRLHQLQSIHLHPTHRLNHVVYTGDFTQEILHRSFYTGTVTVYARVMAQKLLHTSSYTKKTQDFLHTFFHRSCYTGVFPTGVVTQEFFTRVVARELSHRKFWNLTRKPFARTEGRTEGLNVKLTTYMRQRSLMCCKISFPLCWNFSRPAFNRPETTQGLGGQIQAWQLTSSANPVLTKVASCCARVIDEKFKRPSILVGTFLHD